MGSEYRAHVDGHRGFALGAVHVILGREYADGRWEAITELGERPTHQVIGVGEQAPGFHIPADAARALYDALGQYFGGSSDVRQLRKDYDAERGRVDRLITALLPPNAGG